MQFIRKHVDIQTFCELHKTFKVSNPFHPTSIAILAKHASVLVCIPACILTWFYIYFRTVVEHTLGYCILNYSLDVIERVNRLLWLWTNIDQISVR